MNLLKNQLLIKGPNGTFLDPEKDTEVGRSTVTIEKKEK
jgi:hypothetical protein